MKNLHSILAAALAVGGLAFAQDPAHRGQTGQSGQTGKTGQTGQHGQTGEYGRTGSAQDAMARYEVLPADKILGQELKDRSGEKLTEVSDLLIEQQSGEIKFAIVQTGGLMGIGATDRVIPFQHIEVVKKHKGDKDKDKDSNRDSADRSRDASGQSGRDPMSTSGTYGAEKMGDIACELRTTLSKEQLERAPELGDERNLGQDLERRVQAVFGQIDRSGQQGSFGGQSGQSGQTGQTGQTGQSGQTGQTGQTGQMGQTGQNDPFGQTGQSAMGVSYIRLSKLEGQDLHASGAGSLGSTTGGVRDTGGIGDRDTLGGRSTMEGKKVGSIEKIVLAPQNNVVAFVVVSYEGESTSRFGDAPRSGDTQRDTERRDTTTASSGDKMIALPWQELSLQKDRDNDWKISTTADQRQLASAPEFKEDDWRRMSSTPYLQDLYSHFQAEPFWRSSRFASSPRSGQDGMDRQGDLDRQRDLERQRDMERQRNDRDQPERRDQ